MFKNSVTSAMPLPAIRKYRPMSSRAATTPELKKTLALAIPMIFTQLLSYVQPVVDTVMAGREPPAVLASVALGAQMFTMIFLFMIGIALVITTQISKYHGAGDRMRIRRSFQQGLWLTVLLGALTVLLTLAAAWVPQFIGSAADIAAGARTYTLIIAPGGGLFVCALAARYFLDGMSHPRTGILVQLVLIPVNIVGNYVLLKGFWIIPPLGTAGMALSTSLCYALYALAMFHAVWRNPRWRPYRLFKHFAAPDWAEIRSFFRIGLPIALGIIMEAGLFSAVTLIVSRSDAIFTGANQIALNYAGLSYMIPLGLAYALTVRIGNAHGEKNPLALRQRAIGGLYLAAAIMALAALIIFAFAPFIVGLYTNNAAITPIAIRILYIIGIFQLVDGIQVCASGILRGLQDTKVPMLYALIGYWLIGFPCGLLLAYGLGYGIYGLWGGIVAGLACNAMLGVHRVLRMTRMQTAQA